MDPPSKKRSIFGFTSLFRPSPSVEAEDTEMKNNIPVKSAAPAILPRPNFNTTASAPESPAKRASESQMASRKIIGRPHGPSSRLSQSMSASDLSRVPSSNAVSAPRRMPGDNPNKPSTTYATTLVSRSATNELRSTNFSGASGSSAPRSNIFRSSALYSRPPTTNYSPRPPPNPLNQSFPPNTPGRGSRASTAEINGRALVPTSSTELFKMRIQSPPRELTGEKLAKEVPDDMNRTGSVYADEFLAHYCPPELDEQQRRQFFCILDLRRLKYAADEVFTKKDWKINILNFAKEYEKSRSLIMLRYGLYEFKTVRASEAVKREWKKEHGIPDSDDEDGDVAMANGGVKRKAEDQLTPKTSTAFAASVSDTNKRSRAPEISSKNKRKADAVGDTDEDAPPAKLQRPTSTPQKTPSATKSLFENIANSSAKSFTPAKSTSSLFGSMADKPLGSMAEKPKRSIFDSSPKPAPSSNIFGHLSDASKGSGNEGADEGSDTEDASEEEEDDSPAPGASQSEEPASSGETATPQFGTKGNGGSSASSDAGESTQGSVQGSFQGRSLFERITRGSDGQPMRKLLPQEGRSLFAAPSDKERSVSPVKESPTPVPAPAPAPAAVPSNNTWNANTPIKFGAGSTGSLFGAKKTEAAVAAAAKDSSAPASLFAKKAEAAPAPSALFASSVRKPEEAASSAETTPKASAANLFPSSIAPTSSEAIPKAPASNLFSSVSTASAPSFGDSKPATTTGSSLFGSTTSAFGQSTTQEEKKDTTAAPAPSTSALFGAKPADATTEPAKPAVFQSSTLFGSQNKTESAPATQSSDLFAQSTAGAPADKAPSTSLFGATNGINAAKPASNLFGAAPAATTTEAPKFTFGTTEVKPASSLFSSAASTPAPEAPKPAEVKNLFGGITTSAAPATETKSLFGTSTAAPAATESKNLFGGVTTTPAADAKPLFGAAPATQTKPLFGAAPAADAKPLFGAAAPATETKNLFGNIGASSASTPAAASKPLFGATAQTESKPPASLFANPNPSTTAPAAASSNIFSFGGSQTPAPAPAPATTSFNFGASQPAATQSTAPAGGSIFGNIGGANSFSFTAGGGNPGASFNNPFASGQDGPPTAPTSFNFGAPEPAASQSFTFGSNTTGANNTTTIPTFSFGGASDTNASAGAPSAIFSFGGGASQNPTAAPIFGNSLAPVGGTSTGTRTIINGHGPDTPFTFGGASSLATTPAASTPEPSANVEAAQRTNADGDEPPQEQISLTEGGRGEEDEDAVYEVRAKALKFLTGKEDDDESSATDKEKKTGWVTKGVGPLRILKHKETGAVRILLRAEPRGHIALNKRLLPEITYKADAKTPKYVSVVTATDNGKGLEKWMLQVKTKELADKLVEALEENKKANEKKD
ncbi:nucleoporin nup61 [Podospora fimiseda]|uniref:Nucleoporin nup61 n=1 Tax=Podospora fimiseda TaxID=252190 RepID=A0AAN6YPB7_9PEZI|nr:nucleoporin nup61 [Podospora fimiseda]